METIEFVGQSRQEVITYRPFGDNNLKLPCFDEQVEEPKVLQQTYQEHIPPHKAHFASANKA